MAFDFPASPAEGALFQPAGGPLYKFTNGAWTIPSTPPVMSISDTAPANPIPGQLWWESDTGNAFLWFDDGTSRQWVQFNVSSKPTPGSPFKRTLITASSTTFQYDPTTLYADAEVVGGGAAGGATAGTVTAGNGAAGSGGGAGGYTKKLIQITDAIRAATKTIVVGAAGTSGGGGNSSYADTVNTLTGNGGAAGVNGTQSSQIVIRAGGAGGAATGGDLNMAGGQGGVGYSVGAISGAVASAAAAFAGTGGASQFGGGATAGAVVLTTSSSGSGGAVATAWGAGGSGCWTVNNANGSGGAGAQGVVVITEYR